MLIQKLNRNHYKKILKTISHSHNLHVSPGSRLLFAICQLSCLTEVHFVNNFIITLYKNYSNKTFKENYLQTFNAVLTEGN